LAASDTTKNTLLWLLLVLTQNEEYQNKWMTEINNSIEKHGEIIEDECPYISSFLLENLRKYPVADSLWHVATDDVVFGHYKITKGATFQGEYI
jgi:cytochrome P450